jgi:hypothetical protein
MRRAPQQSGDPFIEAVRGKSPGLGEDRSPARWPAWGTSANCASPSESVTDQGDAVTSDTALDSEQIIRRAYKIAEDKDIEGWVAAFTEDGIFTDQSIGVAYQGRPTGKRMDAPCCDVFELSGGKIKRFDCYPSGTVVLTQLGVLGDLSSALEH